MTCTYCQCARDQIREFRENLAMWDHENGIHSNHYPPLPDVAPATAWMDMPDGQTLGLCQRHYAPLASQHPTA